MKKNLIRILAAAALTAVVSVPVYAGEWKEDSYGWYYVDDNGSFLKNVIRNIDGANYVFDENGYLRKGWVNDRFQWKFFDKTTGQQLYNWVQDEGKWYFLDPANDGYMYKGWLEYNKKRYYFDENGVMATGIFSPAGDPLTYQADETGALITKSSDSQGGTKVMYREDGTILYSDDLTKAAAKATGDSSWSVLYDNEEEQEKIARNQEAIIDFASEIMDEYAKKFYERLSNKKGATRENIIERWEATVRTKLKNIIPEEDIEQYIRDVERYVYDEGSYYDTRDEDDDE